MITVKLKVIVVMATTYGQADKNRFPLEKNKHHRAHMAGHRPLWKKKTSTICWLWFTSHHQNQNGIIWRGTNTISRASSSFQMEIRSAKRWKIGWTFAELIRKCAKDRSGKRLSGKMSRKPHHKNNMSQCVEMENKSSFWSSLTQGAGGNHLKIFTWLDHFVAMMYSTMCLHYPPHHHILPSSPQ